MPAAIHRDLVAAAVVGPAIVDIWWQLALGGVVDSKSYGSPMLHFLVLLTAEEPKT
jgi:hypothetical protein